MNEVQHWATGPHGIRSSDPPSNVAKGDAIAEASARAPDQGEHRLSPRNRAFCDVLLHAGSLQITYQCSNGMFL